MHLQHAVLATLLSTCCAHAFNDGPALAARQDTSNLASTQLTVASSTQSLPASTATPTTKTPLSTNAPSSGSSAEPTNGKPISSTISSIVHSSSITVSHTATHTATTTPTPTPIPNPLPIHPKITPAIGIAGVLFILGGLALGFIGIKNRSVQIFLSTAFLVALGVEVLIIYVMSPPVPDAIQGAYLVAGVVGGCIFGGVAIIFKEVAEGFGCMLGGFCFAMWLLVLSPGGTVQSSTGKIILISVFSGVSFSLSFSRYTRNYGLIACTSFAGSTIFILGVDCFSRAGLKEFWLYVWDLNPDEFPLHTNTYPVTRYIRAEVALIIILAVLGTISQIKLWKIVRDRRAGREAARLQDEESKDQQESERGREIEERNRRDRAEWEVIYGDKTDTAVKVDSAIGSSINSSPKDSTSVKDREIYGTELTEMSRGSKRFSKKRSSPLINVRTALGNKSNEALVSQQSEPTSPKSSDTANNRESGETDQFTRNRESMSESYYSSINPNRLSARDSMASSMALPKNSQERDMEYLPVELAEKANERGRQEREIAARRQKRQEAVAPEGDERASLEEDRASSVAATASEDPDIDALSVALTASRAPSPYQLNLAIASSTSLAPDEILEENDDEELCRRESKKTVARDANTTKDDSQAPETSTVGPGDESVPELNGSNVGNLSEHLPRKISRVASIYRTNEWAKEAARAEHLPMDELAETTLDSVRIETKSAPEAARSEENNAAQKPESQPEAVPAPAKVEAALEKSPSSNKNPYRTSKSLSRQSSAIGLKPVYLHSQSANNSQISLQRQASNTSQAVLQRQGSSSTLNPQPKLTMQAVRNFSSPLLNQPLSESPLDTESSQSLSQRQLSSSLSANNLLDAREDKIKRRVTTTSFNAKRSSSNLNLTGQAESSLSRNDGRESNRASRLAGASTLDEEEMTLSERKALVQQRQARRKSASAQLPVPSNRMTPLPQTTWPKPTPARMNSTSQNVIFDSHQPKRTSTYDQAKQGQNWSIWQSQKATVDPARNEVLNGDVQIQLLRQKRQQTEFEAQRRAQEQKAMQEQIDSHMRMGGMHDAHRSALSRMQSKANKHASVQGAL